MVKKDFLMVKCIIILCTFRENNAIYLKNSTMIPYPFEFLLYTY